MTTSNPEIHALAEGLSDIWGAVVEHEYAPSGSEADNWTIGELPMRNGYGGKHYLRNMAFPEDPDAKTQMVREYNNNDDSPWQTLIASATPSNDYNKYALSGVLSYWFYLLVNGDGCTVDGIGWEKAAKIVFYTQRYANSMSEVTGYESFAQATWDVTRALLGEQLLPYDATDTAFTPADLEEVEKAWITVKVFNEEVLPNTMQGDITQNTVWSTKKLIPNTVTIHPGATLTITGTVHFTAEAGLIISPGGKLIVDGGTLTNNCNTEMWQGITVLGTSSLHDMKTPHNPAANELFYSKFSCIFALSF
jgi:hypothetical protein